MPNLNSLINKALREQPKIELLPGSRAQVTTDHSEYVLSYSFDRDGEPVVHSCVGEDRETCVEAVKDAIAFIERDDTYSTDPEVKAASDKLAKTLALAEKES